MKIMKNQWEISENQFFINDNLYYTPGLHAVSKTPLVYLQLLKNSFWISAKFEIFDHFEVINFFEIFIKDLLRNASGYFSGFSKNFCKSSIFRLWESLGSFLVISAGWKVIPGNLESFQKFWFEKIPFLRIFYIQNNETKLGSIFLWRLATLTWEQWL